MSWFGERYLGVESRVLWKNKVGIYDDKVRMRRRKRTVTRVADADWSQRDGYSEN